MKRLGLFALGVVVLAGCGGNGDTGTSFPGRLTPTPEAVNKATKSLTTGKAKSVTSASNAFGFSLLQEVAKKDPAKNVFISPASVAMALTMTFNGSEGGTKTAMEKSLGIAGLSGQELNAAHRDLRTVLASPDKGVKIEIANSLWAREGVTFKREFLGKNEDYFGAKVTTLDFSKPEAPDAINVWVSEATQDKIKQIVDKIPAEMALYLVNAVYFKGSWEDPFDAKQTVPREFTLFDGKKKEVPMMHDYGEYEYQKAEKFSAVRVPYGTGRLGMYVMLPNNGVPVAGVVKWLDGKNWDGFIGKFKKIEGRVGLPKFKSEYSVGLKDALVALGMGEAFEEGKANFTGMAAEPPLFISAVGHKTFVEVNEEGTEAAAVTDVAVAATAAPVQKETFELIANRPFAYAIVDGQTGAILFIGVMGNPEG
jgi:serpin B